MTHAILPALNRALPGQFAVAGANLLGAIAIGAVSCVLALVGNTQAQAPVVEFSILSYSVDGLPQLKLDEFMRIVTPFIGPRKSPEDVLKARDAVQQAYFDFGHCSVQVTVPKAQPNDGIVVFRLAQSPVPLSQKCSTVALRDGKQASPQVQVPPKVVQEAPLSENIDNQILDERSHANLDQITGFVVDRTITNFGAEFMRFFSEAWREIDVTASVDVTIVERPSARFGSVIFVEQNNQPVARVFLYAGRSAAIKPLAVETARYVANQASDSALAKLLMQDPDLGKGDLP